MTDSEWEEVLFRLQQFGFRVVSADSETGLITVRVPRI